VTPTRPRLLETPLAGGPLAQALLAGPAPSGWLAPLPTDRAGWRAQAEARVRQEGAWLAALAPALGPTGAALLAPVADRGVLITTGQQPGLFGGPGYTLAKALSAQAMAAAHEAATGVPTRALFWAATDDADLAEASRVVVPTADGARLLRAADAGLGDGVPVAHVPLGPDVTALRESLVAACGSAAETGPVQATEAYQPGVTHGAAYVTMLRTLLEPLGIAVLDAAHPAVGEALTSWLAAAHARAAVVDTALRTRTEAIAAAGYAPQVDVDRALSHVFAWEGSTAVPTKRRLGVDETVTPGTRLSATVLLRPVAEAWLLPTVAYVAGPGELAYFAQSTAVAEALGAWVPRVLPRWSGLVVPPEVDALLEARGWPLAILQAPHEAENRLAEAALPPEVAQGLAALRAAVREGLAPLSQVLPPRAATGAVGDLGRRLDRIERRVRGALKQREAATLGALRRARGLVYPDGAPQERALSFVPLWARFGGALLDAQRAAARRHAARWWPDAP
jgi:bacillithiol synthase